MARAKTIDLSAYSNMDCPVHGLIAILSGPWTLYILWLLAGHGTLRFGEIKKQMPSISAKMLTERLRMLEELEVLQRQQEATVPLKVTYTLTPRGRELEEIVDAIDDLALRWSGTSKWKR